MQPVAKRMYLSRPIHLDDGSAFVALPEELLAQLQWKAGDTVILTETATGVSLAMPPAEQPDVGGDA